MRLILLQMFLWSSMTLTGSFEELYNHYLTTLLRLCYFLSYIHATPAVGTK